jgi:flagellar biosynthesis/type III secretory pathway chaperone
MLTLSEKRQSIIIATDLHKLDLIERYEFNVIKNINSLKKELTDHLQNISKELGRSEMTVSEVISRLGFDECNYIQLLRDELVAKLVKLEHLNGLNKELLDDHIKITNAILNLMSKVDGTDHSVKIYDSDGNTDMKRNTTSGLIDVVISKNANRMDSVIKERTL